MIISSIDDSRIAAMLAQGVVGILPTDTLYGLVCLADNPAAVQRLYAIKQRSSKPGTVIAASVDQLVTLGLKPRYLKAVEHYWPNPISVIIPSGADLAYLDLGNGSLAVRVTADGRLAELLGRSGPLLTTSANLPGQPPAHNVHEAVEYFGNTVDFYVDGGDTKDRSPSTIIRIVDDAIEIVRQGMIIMKENGAIERNDI